MASCPSGCCCGGTVTQTAWCRCVCRSGEADGLMSQRVLLWGDCDSDCLVLLVCRSGAKAERQQDPPHGVRSHVPAVVADGH